MIRQLILLGFTAVLLAGCGGSEFEDLRDFVKNAGADMRGKIPPLPEARVYEPFAYANDAGLPDPFKPRKPEARSGKSAGLNQPDLDRPKEALEEYPLENLKMVGYLYRNKIGYAIIRAPDGRLHRVKTGNYLGLDFGKIEKVGDTEIVIREVVQDNAGDWSERVSNLQLQE
ncbi:MAG: pilus assembly protein PilP [Gallionella sp.]|jgi:type IV pilus assembly protein PilP|nr:pilus assembly protein PilP [Gallionella sp.]